MSGGDLASNCRNRDPENVNFMASSQPCTLCIFPAHDAGMRRTPCSPGCGERGGMPIRDAANKTERGVTTPGPDPITDIAVEGTNPIPDRLQRAHVGIRRSGAWNPRAPFRRAYLRRGSPDAGHGEPRLRPGQLSPEQWACGRKPLQLLASRLLVCTSSSPTGEGGHILAGAGKAADQFELVVVASASVLVS